jgi:hypothetical protein
MNPNNPDSLSSNNINVLLEIDQLTKNLENIEQLVKQIPSDKISSDKIPSDKIFNQANNTDSPSTITLPKFKNDENLTFVNIFDGVTATSFQEITTILEFFASDTKLTDLINKLSLSLDENKIKYIREIITFLSTSQAPNHFSPMKNIILEIHNILNDGKLNLHDVPLFINLIADIFNSSLIKFQNKTKPDIFIICSAIKILVHAMIDLQIIQLNNNDTNSVNKAIDSSILLLCTIINLPRDLKKCSFWCCWKK